MVNDTIDILDAKIINLAINFEAIGRSDMSKFEIIEESKAALRKHFARYPEIGEPFLITDVYQTLKSIPNLMDVIDVNIVIKNGAAYADSPISIEEAKSADGRYIIPPMNTIFEIKFPNSDITGTIL